MSKNVKRVVFTHHELLELMAVVNVIKYNAAKQRNKAEVTLMEDLTDRLQRFDVGFDGAYLRLDSLARNSLWLCMEKYINFCVETHQHDEYALAVTIAEKLAG